MRKQTLSIDCMIVGINGEDRENEFYNLNEQTPVYLVVEDNGSISISTIIGESSFGELSKNDTKKILDAHKRYALNMWDLNYLVDVEYKACILNMDHASIKCCVRIEYHKM